MIIYYLKKTPPATELTVLLKPSFEGNSKA